MRHWLCSELRRQKMSWTEKAEQLKQETHNALQTVYDELNHGQQQKLLGNEKVKKLLDRYEVKYN